MNSKSCDLSEMGEFSNTDQSDKKIHTKPWRVAFYSHDTSGLGHIRRNILMAKMLVKEFDQVNVLLITGSRDVSGFELPKGIDFVVLPSLMKKPEGDYSPRRLNSSLKKLIKIRSGIIKSAVSNFNPDVLIVDQMPRGVLKELDLTLKLIKSKKKTRCILGLRDILDDREVIRNEWKQNNDEKYIRKYYDQVWIFGDPSVYDAIKEYGFSESIAKKCLYTGYLDPRKHMQKINGVQDDFSLLPQLGQKNYDLCLVGSGQDGRNLGETFARAAQISGYPSIILAGPAFPVDAFQFIDRISKNCSNLKLIRFHHEPTELLKRARNVITLGGYNSVCEILAYKKRALVIPRTHPRKEQLIRALSLEKMGLVTMLHPDQLSANSLISWIRGSEKGNINSDSLNFNGLECVIDLLAGIKRPAA